MPRSHHFLKWLKYDTCIESHDTWYSDILLNDIDMYQ
jgi:hypothetical protein